MPLTNGRAPESIGGVNETPCKTVDNARRFQLVGVFVLLAVASVFVHVLVHGFFYEPDSVSYLSLATNLFHHHGYQTFEGDWCAEWPPLVPVLLGLGQTAKLPDPYPFAMVNAASIAAIVALSGVWLLRLTDNIKLTAAALAIAIVSPPLLSIANAGYTECLFTALCMGALTAVDRYCSQ